MNPEGVAATRAMRAEASGRNLRAFRNRQAANTATRTG